MRIAVLSDIHGNGLALDAVLADIAAESPDLTVNLGDMVSGPLEPARTVAQLIAADFPSVAGNHENYLVAKGAAELGAVDLFAREALTPKQFGWLKTLPATRVVNGEIFMCHGTPQDADTPWLDDWLDGRTVTLPGEATVENAAAAGIEVPVLLCGHTHVPRVVRLADGRLVVNPGSVGLQMHYGAPDARYALIERHAGQWSVTLRAIPYDHAEAARRAAANGFPHWREVLTGGWVGASGLF